MLDKQASLYSDKAAVIFGGRRISFSQLRNDSFKLANYLAGRINRQDKVAVFLPNIPETIITFLGVLGMGAAVIPLDFMLAEEEVIHLVNHSESKILFILPRKGIDLNNIKRNCRELKEIVVLAQDSRGYSSWQQVQQSRHVFTPDVDWQDCDLSSIFYTSGSTGQPKGVMLTFRHFDNPVRTIDHFLKVSSLDSYLCGGVPFSHVGGLDYILLMLYYGSTMVLMERFHPWEFLKNLEQHKVTIFCIVPAMYVAILSLKEYDSFDLSSLRYAVVFGAPSSPVLLQRFHKAYPNARLLNGWGMTETAAPNGYSPEDDNKLNSIGKFDFNMEAKIVNNSDDTAGSGEQGELWVRGEAVMSGYYKAPELTRQVLTEDGWLKTGDVVLRDKEGFYYIAGRIKEMIKVAGELVFSPEVEEKIQCHPKVKEAAVIGVKDDLRGEVPKAFISLKEGESLGEQELKEFLRGHLAHFKIPHYFEYLTELPKNKTGKVDKQLLKKGA